MHRQSTVDLPLANRRREIARGWWADACSRERLVSGMRDIVSRFPRIEGVALNTAAFLTPWLNDGGVSYLDGLARALFDRWQLALQEDENVESKHVIQGHLYKVLIEGCTKALDFTITSTARGANYWDPLVEPLLDYWFVHGRQELRIERVRQAALPSNELCRLAIATRVMSLRDLRLLQEASAGDASYDALLLRFLDTSAEPL